MPIGDVPVYRVTLNDRLDEKERFVTLAHELGHIFCGHLGPCRSRSAEGDEDDSEAGWIDRRHISRGVREVEAEAAAFLIASRAGLVTGSASYLKGYLERVNIDDVDLDVIVRAASWIERIGKISYGKMAFKPTSKS
ncbi:ImmA/IrrE family metallo-endopeptidase [Falsiroseomonas sp. E2-1-a20]|uniref:ImmA/IrrE family metallo-endopeptidase n=1 Tax=Falsiroseomonas sp. E2-1-a20 TaxID=3239300 RepID=UPI003F2E3340